MPTHTTCPISEVEKALSAYINTRGDTLRIRQTISKYLVSSLRPVNAATQNQHLSHECPQNLSAANTNPPGLTGSRLEYLQALRAKNQAQKKHRELQTLLQDMQQRHIDETPMQQESGYDDNSMRAYVSLLRQHQRLAKLQVIQETLHKLLNARLSPSLVDPKAVVKDRIGEQPDLPAERLEQISQVYDDQTWIFRLKQEVLEARSKMECARAAKDKAQMDSPGSRSLQKQVLALERARDEIVEWVQEELAKLEEESMFLEDASPVKRTASDTATPVDPASAETRIRESYNQYTSSRAGSLAAHKRLQQPLQVPNSEQERFHNAAQETKQSQDAPKHDMPITKLLPYLPHLVQTANNDRALLQQSVYLQGQVACSDREIEEALLRLSGESHLLAAGANSVDAWGKTAREAEATAEEFIKDNLQVGYQKLDSIRAVVELCSLQDRVLSST